MMTINHPLVNVGLNPLSPQFFLRAPCFIGVTFRKTCLFPASLKKNDPKILLVNSLLMAIFFTFSVYTLTLKFLNTKIPVITIKLFTLSNRLCSFIRCWGDICCRSKVRKISLLCVGRRLWKKSTIGNWWPEKAEANMNGIVEKIEVEPNRVYINWNTGRRHQISATI